MFEGKPKQAEKLNTATKSKHQNYKNEKMKHLKSNLLLVLVFGLLFNSCEDPAPIACDSFLEKLTNCSVHNWKVTISIMDGNNVTNEINEIWRFKADKTYTRTTVSGTNHFGYDNSKFWLGVTQNQSNTFIYSFSNSNTEFELVAQDAADRPGTTIRRIKFVRQ